MQNTKGQQALQATGERARMRIISCRSSTVICDTKRGDGKGDRNVSRVIQLGNERHGGIDRGGRGFNQEIEIGVESLRD